MSLHIVTEYVQPYENKKCGLFIQHRAHEKSFFCIFGNISRFREYLAYLLAYFGIYFYKLFEKKY